MTNLFNTTWQMSASTFHSTSIVFIWYDYKFVVIQWYPLIGLPSPPLCSVAEAEPGSEWTTLALLATPAPLFPSLTHYNQLCDRAARGRSAERKMITVFWIIHPCTESHPTSSLPHCSDVLHLLVVVLCWRFAQPCVLLGSCEWMKCM